jgi:UDP-N-acetylmuramate-alanine ligase
MKNYNCNRKIISSIFFWFFLVTGIKAQSFNEDKTAFTNFVKRMHTATPFEGVKIIDDYDHQFMISVISIEKAKYPNESMMIRVAQVKAQSQVNTFLNGANISMDMVIKTTESKDSTGKASSVTESIESIKQNSTGFSQGLELLTNFDGADPKRMVFIYFRELKKE